MAGCKNCYHYDTCVHIAGDGARSMLSQLDGNCVLHVEKEAVVFDRASIFDRSITMTIGEHLRFLRKRKGYSMREVTELTGIKGGTLCRYETGKHAPDIDIAEKLLNIYGYTLNIIPKVEKED